VVISPKVNGEVAPRYRDRNRIERIFTRIKRFGRIGTRADETKGVSLPWLSRPRCSQIVAAILCQQDLAIARNC
jgi:hypothetical protein